MEVVRSSRGLSFYMIFFLFNKFLCYFRYIGILNMYVINIYGWKFIKELIYILFGMYISLIFSKYKVIL